MTQEVLDKVLADHKEWLCGSPAGARADLRHADLCCANLCHADLRHADLGGADLGGANLCGANLCGANLYSANLRRADLRYADLRHADLRHANLRHADLRHAGLGVADLSSADLCGANIDYSVWPLQCQSLSVKIDKRIAAQLLYHALRAMQSCAAEPDVAAVLASEPCLRLANQFHRIDECGKIGPPQEGGAK